MGRAPVSGYLATIPDSILNYEPPPDLSASINCQQTGGVWDSEFGVCVRDVPTSPGGQSVGPFGPAVPPDFVKVPYFGTMQVGELLKPVLLIGGGLLLLSSVGGRRR